jgi:6-pyruvoyltetrahydropterin/6-carboxytetrahydropterin synthase
MPLTVMRRVRFCAGHRLLGHEGKCAALHGHNYTAEFHVTAEVVDSVGRVIDFAELKTLLKGWIDEHWDHGFVLWDRDEAASRAVRSVEPHKLFLLPVNPTAEHLAAHLLHDVCPKRLGPLGVTCTHVILWETDEAYAQASIF